VKQEIIVFRYGHREVRDYRVTSHCALVSRALGAKRIIICGEKDESILNTIKGVNERWGSKFKVVFVKSWETELKKIKKKGYCLVHLTMYGEAVQEKEEAIMKHKKICVIIGSQKVEREVYHLSDYNIGVTQQPHSEIAALSIFLDRIQQGKELGNVFSGANRKIVPQKHGKKVIGLK